MTIYTPGEIARERVRKGVKWLNKHAAPGWQRHLYTALSDILVSWRAYDCCADESVLTFAFEDRCDLAGVDGRVHFADILKHFGLTLDRARELGFCTTSDDPVSGPRLDDAWKEAVLSYARPNFEVRIHLTENGGADDTWSPMLPEDKLFRGTSGDILVLLSPAEPVGRRIRQRGRRWEKRDNPLPNAECLQDPSKTISGAEFMGNTFPPIFPPK